MTSETRDIIFYGAGPIISGGFAGFVTILLAAGASETAASLLGIVGFVIGAITWLEILSRCDR